MGRGLGGAICCSLQITQNWQVCNGYNISQRWQQSFRLSESLKNALFRTFCSPKLSLESWILHCLHKNFPAYPHEITIGNLIIVYLTLQHFSWFKICKLLMLKFGTFPPPYLGCPFTCHSMQYQPPRKLSISPNRTSLPLKMKFLWPPPNRVTLLAENENFQTYLPNFHGFLDFRLEGFMCLAIMGTFKST